MGNYNKEPFTVLHIFSGDLWAGAEVMILNLISKLKDESDLKILSLSLNEGILANKLRNVGVETHVVSEAFHSFPKLFLKIFNLFKRKRIDIIHSHRYKENLLALLLAKSLGIKRLVTTVHGLPEPVDGQKGENPICLKAKMDYFLLKQYFTRIVAVSQNMKNELIHKYCFNQGKVDVIYNGIPLPSTNPSRSPLPDNQFHMGTVGRMVPVKDFNLFLEVAAEIRRQRNNVRFSILGDGPLREELIYKARILKIDDCVGFLSPRPDALTYYQSLDLYFNTSLYEGIPLSVLEAMACEIPVVAPAVGGLLEIISSESEGVLVKQRTIDSFVNACIRLIDDPFLRSGIGQSGRKRVNELFGVDRMAEEYHKVYEKIAES